MPDLMADDHQLQPGQVVGKYTIVRELGRGGMGRVYLATEQPLGRSVALKALSPELARDPVYRERFRREAKAAAALTHPGICTIYAFEEIDGSLYLASEFVDGRTLREEVESTPRPTVDLIRRTAEDFASALSSAHRQGITHRDLKPENVMRTTDGRLKILDFGLALVETRTGAFASMAGNLTLPRAVVGTPAYMAPEQLKGERADSRTDVFALGVVLYEYACGTHPFHADDIYAIAYRILHNEPTPIGHRRPDLPVNPGHRHHTMPSQATCRPVHVSDRDRTRVEPRRQRSHARPADPLVADASAGRHRVVFHGVCLDLADQGMGTRNRNGALHRDLCRRDRWRCAQG